ncbi:HlyD family secretion protein [Dyadobacter jiangsuensis]|uniref:HlyD family secretion protein n=1 Tax=Dyadobacter jiangsuensis TaxID=1591085 RepID=A0A2P8FIF3_9BACT|nr:HlyD family efflux transporter periplasmic adaptor subunit [Dyadobacter jiangsuensis]PSL21509.1 HlyD family secretion protein [Dyadobacter jiangsuensis]
MKETIFKEVRSEEVHEIIDRPPHWMLNWGMTMFFIVVVLLVVGSWVIKFPDVVNASFTLTAKDAPRHVIVRSDGRIAKILVRDNDVVTRGSNIAFLESTADHVQVLELAMLIDKLESSVDNNYWKFLEGQSIHKFKELGEIQQDYEVFQKRMLELTTVLRGGLFEKKRLLLDRDLADLQLLEDNLEEQLRLQTEDLKLAREEFRIQEKLQNERVISPLEFNREKAKLLTKEMPLKNATSALIQNRAVQTAKSREILELANVVAEQKASFRHALQTFRSVIESWKQRYVVSAPITGKVSFSGPWQEQQYLHAGQEFLTIEPGGNQYQGLVRIAQASVGKLQRGQRVMIKLNGFPFREYGMVEGVLSQLSVVPGSDSVYWGFVQLPNNLTTLYGKKLEYRNGLTGTAEIITSDRRLTERLISNIRNGKSI